MTDTPNDPAIEKMRARVKEFGEAHEGAIMDAAEWHARAVIAERVVAEECGRELERMWAGCLAHILEMQDRCELTDAVVEAVKRLMVAMDNDSHDASDEVYAEWEKTEDALRAMEPGGDE